LVAPPRKKRQGNANMRTDIFFPQADVYSVKQIATKMAGRSERAWSQIAKVLTHGILIAGSPSGGIRV
jgi:hypothetical protein